VTATPSSDERLLNCVLGVVGPAEDPQSLCVASVSD
jgi:hypothetical protein